MRPQHRLASSYREIMHMQCHQYMNGMGKKGGSHAIGLLGYEPTCIGTREVPIVSHNYEVVYNIPGKSR
jgi:hypothetical protein